MDIVVQCPYIMSFCPSFTFFILLLCIFYVLLLRGGGGEIKTKVKVLTVLFQVTFLVHLTLCREVWIERELCSKDDVSEGCVQPVLGS